MELPLWSPCAQAKVVVGIAGEEKDQRWRTVFKTQDTRRRTQDKS
jgi:hypothetical protein